MSKRIQAYYKKFMKLANDAGIAVSRNVVRYCTISNSYNDEAHNLEHIHAVVKLGVELGNKAGYHGSKEMVIVFYGCLMHDLGCRYNREKHHELSATMATEILSNFGNYGLNDSVLEMFGLNNEMIREVSRCCLEHRSSYAGGPTTRLSTIVALADRGKPNFNVYVMRAFLFRMNDGLNLHEMCSEIYSHLLDKFSLTDGYNWKSYPKEGLELFADEWAAFHRSMLRSNVLGLTLEYQTQQRKGETIKPVPLGEPLAITRSAAHILQSKHLGK